MTELSYKFQQGDTTKVISPNGIFNHWWLIHKSDLVSLKRNIPSKSKLRQAYSYLAGQWPW